MREFRIGGYSFSSYWTMLIIALAVIIVISICRTSKEKRIRAIIFSVLLVLYGCIGAKLLFILENPKAVASLTGGMSFFGSVYFIPAAFVLTAFLFKVSYSDCMDFIAPYVPLVLAFMRIGCFMNGCCGGRMIEFAGVSFIPPVQLIECAFDLGMAILLFHMGKRENSVKGRLYPLFMVYYSIVRMALEFIRDTDKDILYLSMGQWLSIVTFIIGIIILGVMKRISTKRRSEVKI